MKKDLDISKKKSRRYDFSSPWNQETVESHKVLITAPDITTKKKLYKRIGRRLDV